MKNDKPVSCEHVKCHGSGSSSHIEHSLAEMTMPKLMGEILRHCGDKVSSMRSCMCCHYAREIGRRGTAEGQLKHIQALQILEEYYKDLHY